MVANAPARSLVLRCPSNGLAIRSASSRSITAPVDVIVVEEQTRLPLGRPWLSLAVDVPTRMVAGFHLSFDDPSVLAVALVLTHAVLPKEAWLSRNGRFHCRGRWRAFPIGSKPIMARNFIAKLSSAARPNTASG